MDATPDGTSESNSDTPLEPDSFVVERIECMRIRNGRTEYLVKWSGWPSKDNTWEPKEHMRKCQLVLA
jgi:hypothetical protein